MKKTLALLIFSLLFVANCFSQDYNLQFAGVGDGGNYFVKVTATLSKKEYKDAQNWIKRLAVEGVMFRGVAGGAGYTAQKALISDPEVRTTKAEFFDAFYKEQRYLDFVNLQNSSVESTKLPKYGAQNEALHEKVGEI